MLANLLRRLYLGLKPIDTESPASLSTSYTFKHDISMFTHVHMYMHMYVSERECVCGEGVSLQCTGL